MREGSWGFGVSCPCPGRYESVIATLCENLDSLDEPEARAAMIWIVGEYAERIDNADELLESFLEGFHDESTQVWRGFGDKASVSGSRRCPRSSSCGAGCGAPSVKRPPGTFPLSLGASVGSALWSCSGGAACACPFSWGG